MSAGWPKPPYDWKNPPQRRPPDPTDLAAMHGTLNRLWAARTDGRFGALQELFEVFEWTLSAWPHVRYTSNLMALGETLHGALYDACTRNHGGIPHPGTGRLSTWPQDRIVFWNELPPVLALAPSNMQSGRCEACRAVTRHPAPGKSRASDTKSHDRQVVGLLKRLREGRARRAALLAKTEAP